MLSCKEIVKIINSEEKIPLFQRAELKMHLMMCKHCAAYSKHLQALRTGFKTLFSKLTRTEPKTVKDLEEKVLDQLKKNLPEK